MSHRVAGADGLAARVLVIGQGYVGLPIAIRAVEVGYRVAGYELDPARAKSLCAGESYVRDVSSDRLTEAIRTGRYQVSSDPDVCEGFDVAIIAVPTPLRDGIPDMSFIESSARTLGGYLHGGALVVLESTTYPGTTEDLLAPILEAESGLLAGEQFALGYSPERIDPGNPVWRFENVPKVVSGVDARSCSRVEGFYSTLVEKTIAVSRPAVAEMVKLLENTFRHVNIALVNELAVFASDMKIDLWESIAAASTKPFGFMPFYPGPGVGGHCLPIDPSYLSWRVKRTLGHSFRFVELANDINDHMPEHVVARVVRMLNDEGKAARGSRVLILGLAYKRNTADLREAPGPVISQQLAEMGAHVRVSDPHISDSDRDVAPAGAVWVDATADELALADITVIVTDHADFDFDLVADNANRVLDTRHCTSSGPRIEYL
ncbi:MAG: nucleotide sugar dehydrogenase [Acidimicrobiales bacterium]